MHSICIHANTKEDTHFSHLHLQLRLFSVVFFTYSINISSIFACIFSNLNLLGNFIRTQRGSNSEWFFFTLWEFYTLQMDYLLLYSYTIAVFQTEIFFSPILTQTRTQKIWWDLWINPNSWFLRLVARCTDYYPHISYFVDYTLILTFHPIFRKKKRKKQNKTFHKLYFIIEKNDIFSRFD